MCCFGLNKNSILNRKIGYKGLATFPEDNAQEISW
jgi:hypothetical protein